MSSSASSSNNVNGPSASRGSNGPSRGVPPLPIFPNVITGPGSPPGNQPPVTNTIVQAFSKQRTAKEKKTQKAELLADTRRRIISFLAAPTAFHDPSRILLGVFRHHLWCLSTPPQCGIPTFTVGTCSYDVKIKTHMSGIGDN